MWHILYDVRVLKSCSMFHLCRRALLSLLIAGPLAAGGLYFPPAEDAKWQRIAPAKAGWSASALDSAIEFAGTRRSTAVVILYRGKILAERQWDAAKQVGEAFRFEKTSDGQTLEDVASAQKSVAAQLFGIAQRKGLIKLDDPASKFLGAGWSKTSPEQEKQITMRHLLTMTSGLTDGLEYEAAPGSKWRYNSIAYQKVMRALAKASGKSENELTREWLTGPIGMAHSSWRERGNMPGLLGFMSTARDMARFGLLIEAGGVWKGKTVIEDRAYLRDSLRPSQELNPSYGYLWWLNGRASVSPSGARSAKLVPTAPDDLVAALGALGRKIYVVPSLEIVATRTGDNSELRGESRFDEEFWKLLMKGAPGK